MNKRPMSESELEALRHLLVYVYNDEEVDYIHEDQPAGHVFEHIRTLDRFLYSNEPRPKDPAPREIIMNLMSVQLDALEDTSRALTESANGLWTRMVALRVMLENMKGEDDVHSPTH